MCSFNFCQTVFWVSEVHTVDQIAHAIDGSILRKSAILRQTGYLGSLDKDLTSTIHIFRLSRFTVYKIGYISVCRWRSPMR